MDFQLKKLKYRQILNSISQRISHNDLEQMIFICEGVLTESTSEEIQSAFSLFRELEHRNFLRPGKYDFLKEILVDVGRNDLACTMPSNITLSSIGKSVLYSSSTRRSILMQISNQLRKEDVRKMAYLCSCNSDQGLSLMEELEHKGKISDNNYDYLAERLIEIGRHDLSQLLLFNTEKEGIDGKLSSLVMNKMSLTDIRKEWHFVETGSDQHCVQLTFCLVLFILCSVANDRWRERTIPSRDMQSMSAGNLHPINVWTPSAYHQ